MKGLYLSKSDKAFLGLGGGCAGISLIIGVLCLIGWFKHIFYCFAHHDLWFLLIGAVAFPIGIIHGWWLIFTGGS